MAADDDSSDIAAVAAGGWVLFDPCTIMLGDSEHHHAPTAAASLTSNGLAIRVSLRLVPPPAASYVQVSTDDLLYGGQPTVVAADGDLLRIHMVVVVQAESPSSYPYNIFVYRAHPERPSLLLLPPIPDEWQWIGCYGRHNGVVRASREFMAVDLQRSDGMVSELLRFSSAAAGQWELRQLRLVLRDPTPGADLELRCWHDDAVFSSGELVCWADYHQGVLLCDVAANDPDLRFVPFPGLDVWRDFANGRGGAPDRFRAAAGGVGGVLRFVDVDDGRFRHAGKSGCTTVTTWALTTPPETAVAAGWEEEHKLQLADLWERPEYRCSPLPRRTPEYPVFDRDEAHVLHFVLRESYRSTEQWMVTIDMAEGSLRSYEMYKNAIDEEAPRLRARVRNSPLIGSEICIYVSP